MIWNIWVGDALKLSPPKPKILLRSAKILIAELMISGCATAGRESTPIAHVQTEQRKDTSVLAIKDCSGAKTRSQFKLGFLIPGS